MSHFSSWCHQTHRCYRSWWMGDSHALQRRTGFGKIKWIILALSLGAKIISPNRITALSRQGGDTHTGTHTDTHTQTHAHAHSHSHSHTHTHTHTHTAVFRLAQLSRDESLITHLLLAQTSRKERAEGFTVTQSSKAVRHTPKSTPSTTHTCTFRAVKHTLTYTSSQNRSAHTD